MRLYAREVNVSDGVMGRFADSDRGGAWARHPRITVQVYKFRVVRLCSWCHYLRRAETSLNSRNDMHAVKYPSTK